MVAANIKPFMIFFFYTGYATVVYLHKHHKMCNCINFNISADSVFLSGSDFRQLWDILSCLLSQQMAKKYLQRLEQYFTAFPHIAICSFCSSILSKLHLEDCKKLKKISFLPLSLYLKVVCFIFYDPSILEMRISWHLSRLKDIYTFIYIFSQ